MIDPRFYEMLRYLGRGGAYQLYWTPDGEEHTNADGSTWREKTSLWFPTDQVAKVPQPWVDNCNVYFGVHPSIRKGGQSQRAKIEDIQAVNCLFAEFDIPKQFPTKAAALTHIRALSPTPSVLVLSGGGYHAYWLLSDTYTIIDNASRERIKMLQYAWVDYVGGDVVKDLARVLRVPGTLNRKSDYAPYYPTVQIITLDLSHTISVQEAENIVGPLLTPKAQASTNGTYTGIASDSDVWSLMFNGPYGADIRSLYSGSLSGHSDDHSAADYDLCRHLAHYCEGDASWIDRMFRQSSLMRDKWDRDDYRDRTINRAINAVSTFFDWDDWRQRQQASAAAAGAVNGTGPHVGTGPAQARPSATPHSILIDAAADDEGNAVCVAHLHGDHFLYCDVYGWMRHHDGYWQTESAEAMLERAIIDTLIQRRVMAVTHSVEPVVKATKSTSHNVRSCKHMLQSKLIASVYEFDSNPEELNCVNGVINLRTGVLSPHNPSQRFTYRINADYDPGADYVDWIEFLAKVVNDQDLIDYLQMAVGYSITGHTSEEVLFYIYGPTRSGKGTFTETLLGLLPRPLGIQTDFTTFTAKREGDTQNFDLAPLKPARFIVASESSKYDTLNEAKVKQATGGDHIRCAFKHRDHFEYRPQFKIWLISNHPVSGDVDDDAFWARIRVIHFPNSFLGKEDKQLKSHLQSARVLTGVLNWAVKGAMGWFNAPLGLQAPPAVAAQTQTHRDEQDYVHQWLNECCDLSQSGNWTIYQNVYRSYTEWCTDNGVRAKGIRQFGRSLAAKGLDAGVQRRVKGKRVRGVAGLIII